MLPRSCVPVTFVHPAKALGLNDMPFDGDTRVTQSNVAGAPIFHAKKIFGRNF